MFMLHISFLKFSAREELKGEYLRAFIGAIVITSPAYLISQIETLTAQTGVAWYILLSSLLSLLAGIFLTEVFNVSFIKSLMRIKPLREFTDDARRYDPETVLSGFKEGYGRTLKITFLRQLYLLGWGLLAFIPIVLVIGIFAYLSTTPQIAELINLIGQFSLSPNDETALYIGEYIAENCGYVIPLVMGAYLLMFVLMIPMIYKQFEYRMIPFIVAENPDITTKEAFRKTREIMHGYRKKYFCLELSFIVLMMLPALVMSFTLSLTLTYIATAAITPYMTMTYLQFYKERKIMLTPIEEGENKNEN